MRDIATRLKACLLIQYARHFYSLTELVEVLATDDLLNLPSLLSTVSRYNQFRVIPNIGRAKRIIKKLEEFDSRFKNFDVRDPLLSDLRVENQRLKQCLDKIKTILNEESTHIVEEIKSKLEQNAEQVAVKRTRKLYRPSFTEAELFQVFLSGLQENER